MKNNLQNLQSIFNNLNINTFILPHGKCQIVVDCTIFVLKHICAEYEICYQPTGQKDYLTLAGSPISIRALRSSNLCSIGEELLYLIRTKKAANWLNDLRESNLLVKYFPVFAEGLDVEGGKYHAETVYQHITDCFEICMQRDYSIELCLAGLLHDVGKPRVHKVDQLSDGTVKHTFHRHEVVGAELAYNFCRTYGINEISAQRIRKLVRYHMFMFPEDVSDRTLKRWLVEMGPDMWRELFDLRIADRKSNRLLRDRPAVTRHLINLKKRIHKLLKTQKCFKNQLRLCESQPDNLFPRMTQDELNGAYLQLLHIVNKDPNKNNPRWLKDYIQRVYHHGSNNTEI